MIYMATAGGVKKQQPVFLVQLLVVAVVVVVEMVVVINGQRDLQRTCMNELPKLQSCLPYSSGKKESPDEQCCKSASEVRGEEPACLCYIVQQAGSPNGSTNYKQAINQLGLQFPRLLQLPSACNLANTSSSECPSGWRCTL